MLNLNSLEVKWAAGVAPFVQVLCGRIADDEGFSKPEYMAEALEYFLDKDEYYDNEYFHIISTSVGYNYMNNSLREQIGRANMNGKVFVCAASNNGQLNTINISYPGRFGDVICVGASDRKGVPMNFSPKGREIDCLALGENVWGANSSGKNNGISHNGTSQAASFVAGVCALTLLTYQRLGKINLLQYLR